MIPREFLRVVRNAAGLTQEQFAEKLMISYENYKRIELGQRKAPPTEVLVPLLIDCLREHIKRCNNLILHLAAAKIDQPEC